MMTALLVGSLVALLGLVAARSARQSARIPLAESGSSLDQALAFLIKDVSREAAREPARRGTAATVHAPAGSSAAPRVAIPVPRASSANAMPALDPRRAPRATMPPTVRTRAAHGTSDAVLLGARLGAVAVSMPPAQDFDELPTTVSTAFVISDSPAAPLRVATARKG